MAQRQSAYGLLRLVATTTAVTLAALCASASAEGFKREFPPTARRGVLEITAPPEALLNGAPARLSPGARIHGLTNTLVMSGQLSGQRLVVNYVRDTQGLVHQVWILSETEAREKRPDNQSPTNFTYGSDAAKPNTAGGIAPFSPSPN